MDLSEFEVLESVKKDLTSNVAILSGEFATTSKDEESEEDEFDAAFDAIAQESVTKSKLEELEAQFETEDDIFDTTKAEKVLKLASLLDKVEEIPANHDQLEEEANFEDPFDTSAYDHITGKVEEELDFDSIAHRENTETAPETETVTADPFGAAASGSTKNVDTVL